MATKLVSGMTYSTLPSSYIRPESDRPKLAQVINDSHTIPIIDLSSPNSTLIIQQIQNACSQYGFFQVINHGVSEEAMEKAADVCRQFFALPVEEKMKLYSDDPSQTTRLATSFNLNKETLNHWRDFLRLHCYPLDKYTPQWPSLPSSFKETLSTYCNQVRHLGFKLEELISDSLGLHKHCLKQIMGEQEQHMTINFYPACPQPDLTYGIPPHTDPGAITILLQDLQVSGLQVLKDQKWIALKPIPNALVINLGDQMQALSNGRYKSGWHRVIVNSDKPRLSLATFLTPCRTATVRAPDELVTPGCPNVYRDFTFAQYYESFWSRSLDHKDSCLDLFKNHVA